jgi:hypothetical protein
MMDRDPYDIDNLILSGALEICGIDGETGEFFYRFTDKIMEVAPEIFNLHYEHYYAIIMRLWESGVVEINMLSDTPTIFLTKTSFQAYESNTLNEYEQIVLKTLIDRARQDKDV